MKGLLIKDIKVMNAQRTFFIVIIVLAICAALAMDDGSFIVGYLSFVIPMFVLSTISYDEFDNGNTFLFTLPISRTTYVIEKYCFAILLGIASLALAVVLSLGIEFIQGVPNPIETLISVPFLFSVMAILLSVLIPVQIKFGGEKSRIIIFAVGGVALAIGYGVVRLLSFLGVDVEKIVNTISNLHIGVLIAGAIVLALFFLLLSIKISISILQKKEF